MRVDAASLEKGKFLIFKGDGTIKQIYDKIQDLILTMGEDDLITYNFDVKITRKETCLHKSFNKGASCEF